MAPTAPTPLVKSASRNSFYGDAEQAGRSETNLFAQRSASSFSRTSTPNLLRKKTKPDQDSTLPAVPAASGEADSSKPITRPRPRVTETQVSSSLGSSNSTGSNRSASSNYNTSSDGSSSRQQQGHEDITAAGIALASDLPPPPRIPAVRNEDIASRGSSSSLSRLGTPRSVRDLGSDYTRYFNPFATHNNSATDLSNTVPRYNSSTHLAPGNDASKRLSDPFGDEKRMSGTMTPKVAAAGVAGTAVTTKEMAMLERKNTTFDEADPEKAFFPYLDDRLGAPGADRQGYSFPMYWDEKEEDDDMHLPMADDDQKLKPTWRDHMTREHIVSSLGLLFMILGLLCVFVILPVLSSTGLNIIDYTYGTPLDQMPGYGKHGAEPWATVNNRTYPLMTGIRTGLIDPDTPENVKTRTAMDGTTMNLVFSDEFNAQNRTFYPGDDPYFFGFEGWYGATQDLEWYDPDALNTWDGTLEIQLDKFVSHGLNYRSGMLNSWNQLCFKGGQFEVSVSLPGPGGVHGLWPGVWTMGNLGRPGYLATTDGMWPYTYNECDAGITPNQSMTDGTSELPGQRLTSCGCKGSDHPTPGKGRGAPEIDIIEVSGDWAVSCIALLRRNK